MHQVPYPYIAKNKSGYTFISSGKAKIVKKVEFMPTGVKGVYNLAFGDLLPDGSINDKSDSNNGDIVRVLATVIHILKDYLKKRKNAKIVFAGSTPQRTALYQRILKAYYNEFSNYYLLTASIHTNKNFKEVDFDPFAKVDYQLFFIRKK